MILGGFQRLTLIDYPGKLATTVFTVGCPFRCPFCHNPELVIGTEHSLSAQKKMEKDFFNFLETRQGKLDGVCITGGEPTIQPDIIKFIKKIKEMDYAVKLDTNGIRPDIVKKLIDQKLIDYIAMDIKNQPNRYDETAGVKVDIERIKLSLKLIMNSPVPYEFRTTVVPGIHTPDDFVKIAQWIKGAKKYWLQKYEENKILDESLKSKTKNKEIDLEKIKKTIEKYFGEVHIRE